MRIQRSGQPSIEVFTISPRTTDEHQYWPNIERAIEWSDRHGGSGVLLFTGNDTYVEPWLAAQTVCQRSRSASPLVAVNPIYMHPFTTAKMVSSLAYLFGRKTYLNMVTGTAISYLQAMADELSHAQRYERLREYGDIVRALLTSDDPVTYEGQHYQIKNLVLRPKVPAELLPEFFFAGQSDGAVATARELGGVHLQMLPPQLAAGLMPSATGVNFGLITRPTRDQAWSAARARFPEDRHGQRVLALSMSNTESVWKQRLKKAAEMEAGSAAEYWLDPFRNFQSDCPYLVGDYEQVSEILASLITRGIRAIVLDLPRDESEYRHAAEAFSRAARLATDEMAAVGW